MEDALNLNWSLSLTASDRDGNFTVTIDRSNITAARISSIQLDQREDVLSSVLQISFPNVYQFRNQWSATNPFAVGATGVLKVEGVAEFTGLVTDFAPVFSANDRSCVVTLHDKLWATKDAVVELNLHQRIKQVTVNLTRHHAFTWNITGLNQGSKYFEIAENDLYHFLNGNDFRVYGSTGNNGDYTCNGDATWTGTHTRITVNEAIPNATADGAVEDISYMWASAAGTFPWVGALNASGAQYIIPLWIKEPKTDGSTKSYRIISSEYNIVYDLGAVYMKFNTVKVLGPDSTIDPDLDGMVDIDVHQGDIWAKIAYYDDTDTTTKVSNILKTVFEYDADDGGLGWTDGVDFTLQDTPQDKLNEKEWHTKQGDGDCQSFVADLYDNPKTNFPVNYWIRDFMGQGKVEGRYVFQQTNLVLNGDCTINPTSLPSGNWTYDDTDWSYDGVNNEFDKDANGTGALKQEIYAIETYVYKVTFTVRNWSVGNVTPAIGGTAGTAVGANGSFVQYIQAGAWSSSGSLLTKTLTFTPSNTSRFSITDIQVSIVPKDVNLIFDGAMPTPLNSVYNRAVLINNSANATPLTRDLTPTNLFSFAGTTQTPDPTYSGHASGLKCLTDGRGNSSWGWYKTFPYATGDTIILPQDQPLFSMDLGSVKTIDRCVFSCIWTFTGVTDDTPHGQPLLSGQNGPNLYHIWEPQRITVEYNTSTTATPDPNGWYQMSPELFMVETTPGEGTGETITWSAHDSWKVINNINVKARHVRVIVNNPMLFKSVKGGWRTELWFLTEFSLYSKNRLLDASGILPEVRFTDDPNDIYRFRFGLDNTIVDMYRPVLMDKLNAETPAGLRMGLKWKTLFIEDDDLFDFAQKLGVDPNDVSVGYKYLVSRLDAASRENVWTVSISPRPDIKMGDIIFSSRLNPTRYFLVHGLTININPTSATESLTLTDHDFTPTTTEI